MWVFAIAFNGCNRTGNYFYGTGNLIAGLGNLSARTEIVAELGFRYTE